MTMLNTDTEKKTLEIKLILEVKNQELTKEGTIFCFRRIPILVMYLKKRFRQLRDIRIRICLILHEISVCQIRVLRI